MLHFYWLEFFMYELSYLFSALINIMCNAILHKIYVFVALFFLLAPKGPTPGCKLQL